MEDVLKRLLIWYTRHCDGDWEHYSGVTIGTLDNPGWWVDVALEGTELEDRVFDASSDERDEHDWVCCWKEGLRFKIACGPHNLEEGLSTFLRWSELGGHSDTT